MLFQFKPVRSVELKNRFLKENSKYPWKLQKMAGKHKEKLKTLKEIRNSPKLCSVIKIKKN